MKIIERYERIRIRFHLVEKKDVQGLTSLIYLYPFPEFYVKMNYSSAKLLGR